MHQTIAQEPVHGPADLDLIQGSAPADFIGRKLRIVPQHGNGAPFMKGHIVAVGKYPRQ